MTVRIWYEVSHDAQYMVIYSENTFDRSRTFVAGKEPITVAKGERPPDSAIHQIWNSQLVELLDALLAHGIRPSSNQWAAGHVSDLKAHIHFAEGVVHKLLDDRIDEP